MTQPGVLFTVGYSTHPWADFLALLRTVGVTAVADVRSHPAARLEEYRRENLAPALKEAGVEYAWLGAELGARRDEPECYVDGRADYGRIARLPAFRRGVERLERGAAEHVVALLCAEREPLDCHRGVLIARVLKNEGWRVRHLMADGSVEEHDETERRLVDLVGRDPLFDGELRPEQLVDRAYEERGRELAYRLVE